MTVQLHPHARIRMVERGATEDEVKATVTDGESFQAKFGRKGFRRNFPYGKAWLGKVYATKQIEVYAVKESGSWLVISLITRYY